MSQMIHCCKERSRTIIFCFAISLSTTTRSQDVPPPKPQPSTAPTAPKHTTGSQATTASILVKADVDCRIQVDDKELGLFKAGATKSVHVILGEHLIHAVGEQGGEIWETKVTLSKPEQVVVVTQLSDVINRNRAADEARVNAERAADEARVNAERAAKAQQDRLQQLRQAMTGRWTFSQTHQNSPKLYHKTFNSQTGKTSSNLGTSAEIAKSYTLTLRFDDGSVEGDLSLVIDWASTRREMPCCTYEYALAGGSWRSSRTGRCALSYIITGSLTENNEFDLQARYEHSVGACGDFDRDPRSNDIRGTLKQATSSELEWTSRAFEPETAVLHRD
jgi:hypothetical protein